MVLGLMMAHPNIDRKTLKDFSKTEVVSGFRNTPDIGSLKVKDATEDVAKALEVAELERNARFK